jgi:hypothetical protein
MGDGALRRVRRSTAEAFCACFDSHPGFARFERQFRALYGEIYDENALIVFHCEFSVLRAPAAIEEFARQHADAGRDPAALHAFVLDGGYSQFWQKHKQYCEGEYAREMDGMRSMWVGQGC